MTNRRPRRPTLESLERRTAPVVVVPLPTVQVQVAPPSEPPDDPMPDAPAGPVLPA